MIGAVVGVQPFGGHGLSGTGPKAGGPLYVRRLLSLRPPLSLDGLQGQLAGPVGEHNGYALRPKGTILCVARDPADLQAQFAAVNATGNRATMDIDEPHLSAALFAGKPDELIALNRLLAERDGPIVPVHVAPYPLEFLFDEVSLSVNTAAPAATCQPDDDWLAGMASRAVGAGLVNSLMQSSRSAVAGANLRRSASHAIVGERAGEDFRPLTSTIRGRSRYQPGVV